MNQCCLCIAACAAAWLVAVPAGAVAPADDKEPGNPFRLIAERNVFGLRPPPAPQEEKTVETPPPPPPAKVILTGILNVLGPPRALFEIVENEAGKAGNPKKPILREGEREGPVEVLAIDIVKNTVRIRNGNLETNLTFEALKQTGGPAVAAAAAAPPPPLTLPPLNPPATTTATPLSTGRGRSITVAGAEVPDTTPASFNSASSGMLAMNTGYQIPSRQIRGNQPQPPGGQQQTVDPVTQWITMKAEKERANAVGRPYPPPPPVPGMPETNGDIPTPTPGDGGGAVGGVPPPPAPPGFPPMPSFPP